MTKQYENSVAYKYIVYKTKKFVGGSRNKTKYMDSFDSCIYEIFGISHFTRKLNEAYDSRDIIAAIDRIGAKYLIEIYNNNRLSSILKEMVDINFRMRELKKEISKQSRKGKRDKYSTKEYQYLQNLYKKAGKYLRSKLGIKNAKTAYKRRYRAINDAIGSRYDDDSFSSIFMSNGYDFDDPYDFDDDPYEDDGYDYDESSELEDFARLLHGKSTKPNTVKKKFRSSEFDDLYEDDDEDEEWDDIDDEDIDPYSKPRRSKKRYNDDYELNPEYDERLDKLTDVVVELANDVQALINKDEYVQRNFKPKQQPVNVDDLSPDIILSSNQKSTSSSEEIKVLTDFVGKLSEEINNVKKDNQLIVAAIKQLIETQNQINDVFDSIFEDDDDEESDAVIPGQPSNDPDVQYNPPVVEGTAIHQLINRHEDPYEDDDDSDNKTVQTVNPDALSREELIDKINASEEVKLEKSETRIAKLNPKGII